MHFNMYKFHRLLYGYQDELYITDDYGNLIDVLDQDIFDLITFYRFN